jgi:hypothetical protein
MRTSVVALVVALVASSAKAQTHPQHTAAHDSAHAVMLDDAQHMALHQLLLGRWTGVASIHGDEHRDTLSIRFENDSLHQQLLVRDENAVSPFQIRGDTLSWNQLVGGSPCVASTRVSSLLETTKARSATQTQIKVDLSCGRTRTGFTLTKAG